jgi:hypothetical protein
LSGKRPPVFQHAWLVNDLDASIRGWYELTGAGPWVAARHHRTDRFLYRGEAIEADVSYAFAYCGATMIQLIQQHDDTPSIYREMYAAGQEGFHHIAMLVSDFDGEKRWFTDRGFEVACELYADNVDAAYIDTRSTIGCFTEIHHDPPHIVKAFAAWKRRHETWDGTGSLVLGE